MNTKNRKATIPNGTVATMIRGRSTYQGTHIEWAPRTSLLIRLKGWLTAKESLY